MTDDCTAILPPWLEIRLSPIHGLGLFTQERIYGQVRIAPIQNNEKLLDFINDGIWGQAHGVCNVYIKDGFLWSYETIEANEELLLDYGKSYWMKHFFGAPNSNNQCSS